MRNMKRQSLIATMIEPNAGVKVAAAVLGVSAERKGRAIAIFIIPATPKP